MRLRGLRLAQGVSANNAHFRTLGRVRPHPRLSTFLRRIPVQRKRQRRWLSAIVTAAVAAVIGVGSTTATHPPAPARRTHAPPAHAPPAPGGAAASPRPPPS